MYNEVLDDLVVVKRSGQRVPFNSSKVAIAIKSAFESVENYNETQVYKIFERVLGDINSNYRERKTINVEDIQDIIEKVLIDEKNMDVYYSFKEYREKRALSRKIFQGKQTHKFTKALEKIEDVKLDKNKSDCESLFYNLGKIITNEYTKTYILDSKSNKYQEEGYIYIHDIDYFATGKFSSVHLLIDKNKPSLFNYILLTMINARKEISNVIALDDIDNLLEDYFLERYKDKFKEMLFNNLKLFGFDSFINYKKIEDIVSREETIPFNIENYNSVLVNNELINIFNKTIEFLDAFLENLIEKKFIKLFNGLESSTNKCENYNISFGSNNNTIGKIINNKILDIIKEKEYKNISFTYKINNIEIENVKKLMEIIEKNNNIYFSFNEENYLSDGSKIYTINNLESKDYGKISICTTSINMARLGLKYKDKRVEEFYDSLFNILDVVKNELVLSFENIGDKTSEYYKVLFKGNILDDEKLEPGQKIRKVIKNGTLNVGLIGLDECLSLIEPNESKRKKLTKELLNKINMKLEEYSKDTKLNFALCEPISVEARSKLLSIDKSIYGSIKNITDKKKYSLMSEENYKELALIENLFTGGKLIKININGKLNIKKLVDELELLKQSKVSFAKIEVLK